ncbi:hypothetical protein BDM02DRAFT_3133190 [Thelephora ganbajun]|uniref:Uncharacterized protein n=1 Tax=Thelephora ganbajun TaxID=370292 RepID=A0ACB6YYC8_THEGA|nr:hypothetical protein BDM02DRAFT_3133190 [Thelephora ganbajun]
MGIPQKWKDQFPGDITIQTLLQWPLPRQGSAKCDKDLPISAFFSYQEPGEYEETLGELQEIPSVSYITLLERMMKEVIGYWRSMTHAITSKKAWVNSVEWLKDGGYLQPLVEEYLCHLPWTNPPSARLMFSMNDLPILLSDQWLSDTHIDFFATLFGSAATKNTPLILITTLAFPHSIMLPQQSREFIDKIVDEVKEGKLLYTPFHLDSHWVVVCVDVGKKELSYGDSKEPIDTPSKVQRHTTIKEAFLPFAKAAWDVDLEWKGNSLPQARQHDGSSCGPCTINFLEQLVHKGTDPWTPFRAFNYRISLFLQMAQYALKEMAITIEDKDKKPISNIPSNQNDEDAWFSLPPSPSPSPTQPSVSSTHFPPSPTSSDSPAELPVVYNSWDYQLPRTDIDLQAMEYQPESSCTNSPLSTTGDQMDVDSTLESPSKGTRTTEADRNGSVHHRDPQSLHS